MLRITGYTPDMPHTSENEIDIIVPPTLVPGMVDLDVPDLNAWLVEHRKSTNGDRLRIQTRREYGVLSDQDFFQRYLDGRAGPTDQEIAGWGKFLDEDRAAGRAYRNLHVVDGDIGDYLRYQFEWAYTFNIRHGMDIRIVDVRDQSAAAPLLHGDDFWVVEGRHVATCSYDDEGRPQGGVAVDDSAKIGYIMAAEIGWRLGTPFATWWAAHPQYHRVVDGVG